jgi:BatD DUF11 like domain
MALRGATRPLKKSRIPLGHFRRGIVACGLILLLVTATGITATGITATGITATGITATGMTATGMTACRQKEKTGKRAAKPDTGIHKTYARGPATCLVDVDKSEITIADRLKLTITVISAPDYEAELPPIGEKLAQFGIVDYHTTAPELTTDGKTRITRSYVLEPFLSGDYTIPSVTVSFWKTGEKDKDLHTIQTEDISIKVKSLLPEKLEHMKLHDIEPPVALPFKVAFWVWIVGAGGGLFIIGIAAFFIIWKRRGVATIHAQLYLSPHEQAYQELEALSVQNLIEKGEIKRFYQAISGILRRYIENRFGINAPELTTEEFLEALKTNTTFPLAYQNLLKIFLTHCDLVKFAAHHPTSEDIQNTLDSCKRFIEETKTRDPES